MAPTKTEIVSPQEIVDKNTDQWKLLASWNEKTRTDYLQKYHEWKTAKSPTSDELFSQLKVQLQTGWVTVGNEIELIAISETIQKFQDGKIQLQEKTLQATGDVKEEFTELHKNASEEVKKLSEGDFVASLKTVIDFVVPLSNLDIQKDWLTPKEKQDMLPYKPTLSGISGSVLLQIFKDQGYRLRFSTSSSRDIEVYSDDRKTHPTTNIQLVLNDAIKKTPELRNILQAGLLYSSENFRTYATLKGDNTAVSSTEYAGYLQNLSREKNLSPEDEAFLYSQYSYEKFNFSESLSGVKYLDAVNQQAVKMIQDPKVQQAADQIAQNLKNPQTADVPPALPGQSDKPHKSYLTEDLIGQGWQASWVGKVASEVIWWGFTGFWKWVWDIMKLWDGSPLASAGIGVALIYGIWKMFHLWTGGKFSFGRWLLAMFGLWAVNDFKNTQWIIGWESKPSEWASAPAAAPDWKEGDQAGKMGQPQVIAQTAHDLDQETGTEVFASPEAIRRKIFWKKESETLDTENSVIGPLSSLSAYQLSEAMSWKTWDERQEKWEKLFNSSGFNILSPSEKKKITDVTASHEKQEILQKYITGLMALSVIQKLKKDDPAKFNSMSIKEMEDFVVSHANDTPTTEAQNIAATAGDKGNETPILTQTQSIFIRDGKYYLVGPNGKEEPVNYDKLFINLNIPKNAPENLKKSVSIMQDAAFLLDAFMRKYPKKQDEYDASVKNLEWLFNADDVQMGKKVLSVGDIFPKTLWSDVNSIFSETDPSTRRMRLLLYVRDELKQYDLVADNIVEKNALYFQFPADENFLNEGGDLSGVWLSKEDTEKVRKKIREARVTAEKSWNDNYDQIIQGFQAQYPGEKVDPNKAMNQYKDMITLAQAKREVAYLKLYNKTWLSPELALYQDILGAGTWDMSDKAWDFSKEAAIFVGIEACAMVAWALTAWAWAVAVNAMAFGRNAYRGAELVRAYEGASALKRYGVTGARIIAGWVGFNVGTWVVHGVFRDDWSTLSSKEAYLQSIAMVGVMGALGKFFSSAKAPEALRMVAWKGFWKNAIAFTGQVAIEGAAIFGTSGVIWTVMFDGRDNWTLEQMGQAMMMAAVFKGMSAGKAKLFAEKDPNGSPVVKLEEPVQPKASGKPKQTTDILSETKLIPVADKKILEVYIAGQMKTIGANKEISLWEGKLKNIGTDKDPRFLYEANGTTRDYWNSKETLKKIMQDDTLLSKIQSDPKTRKSIEAQVKSSPLDKEVKIDDKIVSVNHGEIYIKDKSGNILTWKAKDDFINKNIWQILQKYGVDLTRNTPANQNAIQRWIHTMEEITAKSKKWKGFFGTIFKDLLQGVRTPAQILDTLVNSSGRRKSELMKILILGDRESNWKDWKSYQRLAFSAGMTWMALHLNKADDLGPEEIMDVMMYNLLGSIWLSQDLKESNVKHAE